MATSVNSMDLPKVLSEAMNSIRSISTACLGLLVVFALALPTLRETSDEERIIPDLVTWAALENVLPLLSLQYDKRKLEKSDPILSSPTTPLKPKLTKDDTGKECPQAWLKMERGLSQRLGQKTRCPMAIWGFYVPGHSGGDLLLLYSVTSAEDSIVEELLYPDFYTFDSLPEGKFIPALPTHHYVIAKFRKRDADGKTSQFIVLPKDEAEKLLSVKVSNTPGQLPYAGPFNSLTVQQVLWRAGKAHLAFGPRGNPQKYFEELNAWLADRIRNPPKVTAFGIGMDPTISSSVFGVLLGLIGFSMTGPYLVLRNLRNQMVDSSWTMSMRTSSPNIVSFAVEAVASVLSIVFISGPVAVVGLELFYGILRPFDSLAAFTIAAVNIAAALVASVAFFFVAKELRRRRRL